MHDRHFSSGENGKGRMKKKSPDCDHLHWWSPVVTVVWTQLLFFFSFLPFPTYLPLHVDDTCHTDPGAEGWELGATSATSSGGQNQWTKSVSFPSSVPATSTLVDKGANGLLIDGEKYWIQLSDYLRELLPRCRRRCNLPSPIAPFHYLRKT